MNDVRFERRLIAYLIDYTVSLLLSIGLYFLLKIYIDFIFFDAFFYIFVIKVLIYTLINSFLLKVFKGKTIGGIFMKTRVISLKHSNIRFKDILIRTLEMSIEPLLLLNAGYMLFKHTDRTIFDILSSTSVISD